MSVVDKTPPVGVPTSRLQVGDVVSVDGLSHGRLLALAVAGPSGDDPVRQAIHRSLRDHHPDVPVTTVPGGAVDRATPERRYSLVRVRSLPTPSGQTRDVMVMHGDLGTVLGAAVATREGASVVRRGARRVVGQGGRPLAVAAAPVADDGTVGEYRLQGFVGLHRADAEPAVLDQDGAFTRVRLWPALLRWQHWLNLAAIVLLSTTGYLIMDPSLLPSTVHVGEPSGFLMGAIRFVHFATGFTWLVLGLTRVVLAFTTSHRYVRWTTLWPLKSKRDVRHLGQVVGHYAFVRREAPLYLGHNPMQQLGYLTIYVAAALQMASGLVLFGLAEQSSGFWQLVSTPAHWWGIPSIRAFHAVMMFLIWAFVIVHVYLVVRSEPDDRRGTVSSMFNGYVWLRRGSKPVDAPDVE